MPRSVKPEPSGEGTKLRQTDFSQKVVKVDGAHLYVRRLPSYELGAKEMRRYFIGTFPLAEVDVYPLDFPKPYKVRVIDRSRGNGTTGLETEDGVHAFLLDLLKGKPNP